MWLQAVIIKKKNTYYYSSILNQLFQVARKESRKEQYCSRYSMQYYHIGIIITYTAIVDKEN